MISIIRDVEYKVTLYKGKLYNINFIQVAFI